ncbi:hypothetical protein HDV03_004703 [Kappamyces sp. JEL0829]|nr:hypothetical protein HDV03_004703 [Kappamyces sp. JEL0829]
MLSILLSTPTLELALECKRQLLACTALVFVLSRDTTMDEYLDLKFKLKNANAGATTAARGPDVVDQWNVQPLDRVYEALVDAMIRDLFDMCIKVAAPPIETMRSARHRVEATTEQRDVLLDSCRFFPTLSSLQGYFRTVLATAWVHRKTDQPTFEELYRALRDLQQLQSVQSLSPQLLETLQSASTHRWSDIGGYGAVKTLLEQSIVWFYKHRHEMARIGIAPSKGTLLYGPPGCGKTLLAQSISKESGASFVAVKVSEIIKSHVGESEKALASLFDRARSQAPCILFLDEIDAVFSATGGDLRAKMCAQIITELDRLDAQSKVVVLAATNHLAAIDPTLLCSGRIDRHIFVGLPSVDDRIDILSLLLKKQAMPLAGDVDVSVLASLDACVAMNGAAMNECIRRACITVATQSEGKEPMLTQNDLLASFQARD